MNIFEFMALVCALAGAVVGATLGFSFHPLMSVGGFFAGGFIGYHSGPFVALGFFLIASLVCDGPRSFVSFLKELYRLRRPGGRTP